MEPVSVTPTTRSMASLCTVGDAPALVGGCVKRLMAPSTATRRLRVLIADDSIAVQQSLARLLNECVNVEVVGQVHNGVEALSAIRELKPEVVILDIRMPGRSGLEVLESIHPDERAPKVIVFTNYPFVRYRRKCLEAGASFFFDKSTEFDQIPQALEQLSQAATLLDKPTTDEAADP